MIKSSYVLGAYAPSGVFGHQKTTYFFYQALDFKSRARILSPKPINLIYKLIYKSKWNAREARMEFLVYIYIFHVANYVVFW